MMMSDAMSFQSMKDLSRSSCKPDDTQILNMKKTKSQYGWPFLAFFTWLAALGWIWTKIGTTGMGWGFPLSALVTLPTAGTFLWLGCWVQGRPGLLFSAFAWGASVAGFCAIWSQEGLQLLVDTQVGSEFGHWFGPLVITPVTEELFKGLFLIWMLVYRRTQIRGLLDGIVYGGLIGAGFAFSEQIMYFGKIMVTYLASDPANGAAGATLVMSFLLRGLMVPFMHSFFVAFIGLGVAAAARIRNFTIQIASIFLGFIFPTALHGVWDWAGLASGDPFMIYKIYVAVMLPLFLAMAILALKMRQLRKKAIVAALPGIAEEGHVARHEAALLGNLKKRHGWRHEARQRAGRAAARLTGRYQAEASALAMLTLRASAAGRHEEVKEQVQAVHLARSQMEAAFVDCARKPLIDSL
jgi:RsiW-degrading membrane proteinase PrsW (M82 family)